MRTKKWTIVIKADKGGKPVAEKAIVGGINKFDINGKVFEFGATYRDGYGWHVTEKKTGFKVNPDPFARNALLGEAVLSAMVCDVVESAIARRGEVAVRKKIDEAPSWREATK